MTDQNWLILGGLIVALVITGYADFSGILPGATQISSTPVAPGSSLSVGSSIAIIVVAIAIIVAVDKK